MKQSIHDIAIDLLKERLNDARTLMNEDYKGVRPFRYQPPPERESLYYYMNMTPEQKQFAQQSFGDSYTVYEQKMELLKKKFKV
jgi:hypothetical protein